jgi:hypothetical protein
MFLCPLVPSNQLALSCRTVHTVGHDQWSHVFGRLFEDYVAGKDLANWNKYLPDKSGVARSSATSMKGSHSHTAQHIAAAAVPHGIPGGKIVAEKSSTTTASMLEDQQNAAASPSQRG